MVHYYYLHFMTLGKISKRKNEKTNSNITAYNSCAKFLVYFWLSRRTDESVRVSIQNAWELSFWVSFNNIAK